MVSSRGRRAMLLLSMVAVATVVYALRRPGSIVTPSLVADDGRFFTDALAKGWGALLEGYNGQLFLLDRAVAAAAASLPALVQPAVYAVSYTHLTLPTKRIV